MLVSFNHHSGFPLEKHTTFGTTYFSLALVTVLFSALGYVVFIILLYLLYRVIKSNVVFILCNELHTVPTIYITCIVLDYCPGGTGLLALKLVLELG